MEFLVGFRRFLACDDNGSGERFDLFPQFVFIIPDIRVIMFTGWFWWFHSVSELSCGAVLGIHAVPSQGYVFPACMKSMALFF